jgi:outer membrane immunogenic protein
MRRFTIALLLTAVSSIALTQMASAADLPRKAPKYVPPPLPPAPVYRWTGCYIGVNAGGAWGHGDDVSTTASPVFVNTGLSNAQNNANASAAGATTSISTGNNGNFIGGGQVGCNWQFATSWVAGLEADFQGLSHSHDSATTEVITPVVAGVPPGNNVSDTTVTKQLDWLSTFRARVGFLMTPTFLVYGTGGVAFGKAKLDTLIVQSRVPAASTLNPFSAEGSVSDTRTGWTAGAGVEWMFVPNWSVKAEWLHYDLGTVSTDFNLSQFNTSNVLFFTNAVHSETRFSGDIVRAGVNFHF